MKKHIFAGLAVTTLLVLNFGAAQAQYFQDTIVNTVHTAVPFLRIPPDARSGAMGDVGIAISPDANAQFHNPAKLPFNESPVGISVSYTPWLRSLVNDIYLAYLTGYFKIDDLQSIGLSLRYFSLGTIQFTDVNGQPLNEFRPNEFAVDGSYSRKLSEKFSAALALRFIYSNLAAGQQVSGQEIRPGTAASADVAFYYTTPLIMGDSEHNLSFGLNISNIGSKITYTESAVRDFLPANIGFGTTAAFNLDDHNQINLSVDLNKLLAPTPSTIDEDGNAIYDYRELSVPAGILGSFSDAPGGFSEEMREIMYSIGAEYWYDQQFAVRAGYFNEHNTKGARKFFAAGLGLKYSVFGLDFSYLIPTTNQRNPLDNTLRFTLKFDLGEVTASN